jgi:hypothetical protein
MPTIFRKTAKGVAEIETRAHRLPPRMRSMLILVDGKRDDGDLRQLITQQADETLQALAGQGFIEAVGETVDVDVAQPVSAPAGAPAAATPIAAPVAPAAAPAAPVQDVNVVRKAAIRMLNEMLGPSADVLAVRMEKVRSMDELRPLLGQAAKLILAARGRAPAEAFAAMFPAE